MRMGFHLVMFMKRGLFLISPAILPPSFQIMANVWLFTATMLYQGICRPFLGKSMNKVQIINDFLLLEATTMLTMFTLLVPSAMTRYEIGWWFISVIAVQLLYNYLMHIIPATLRLFYIMGLRTKNIIDNQLENWKIDKEHNLERVSHQGLKDIKTQIKKLN